MPPASTYGYALQLATTLAFAASTSLVFKTKNATSADRALRRIAKITANFLPTLFAGLEDHCQVPWSAPLWGNKNPAIADEVKVMSGDGSRHSTPPAFPLRVLYDFHPSLKASGMPTNTGNSPQYLASIFIARRVNSSSITVKYINNPIVPVLLIAVVFKHLGISCILRFAC